MPNEKPRAFSGSNVGSSSYSLSPNKMANMLKPSTTMGLFLTPSSQPVTPNLTIEIMSSVETTE